MNTRPDIRNVAIIAHVDHGKTTLVDAMLRQSGVFREGQHVATRVMDSNPLERERGITILAKNTAVRHGDVKFNIVDTPGHSDFGGEVERVLQMVQGVLLLVDAAEGVMPQTRFVLRKALELDLRAIVVVNKIDRKDARAQEVVNEDLRPLRRTRRQRRAGRLSGALHERQGRHREAHARGRERLARTALRNDRRARSRSAGRRRAVPDADLARSTTTGTSDASASGASSAERSQRNEPIVKIARDGNVATGLRLTKLLTFAGLERIDVEEASAGDIVCVSGIEDLNIGDTIADANAPGADHAPSPSTSRPSRCSSASTTRRLPARRASSSRRARFASV